MHLRRIEPDGQFLDTYGLDVGDVWMGFNFYMLGPEIPSSFYAYPTGGVTICFHVVDDPGFSRVAKIGIALCHNSDMYIKKVGREVSHADMLAGKLGFSMAMPVGRTPDMRLWTLSHGFTRETVLGACAQRLFNLHWTAPATRPGRPVRAIIPGCLDKKFFRALSFDPDAAARRRNMAEIRKRRRNLELV